MPNFVAIDIETTGLDPKKDAIIEIGAVRFSGRRVVAEWSSLINPNRQIPPNITRLTGISNEMIRNAPPLSAKLDDLISFVGDDVLVGQNIGFDLAFLNRAGALKENDALDTYELASVLMPTASRYNLAALAQQLGIFLPVNHHRALDDAQLTHAVFNALLEKVNALPLALLAEIVRLADLCLEGHEWRARSVFHQALLARTHEVVSAKKDAGIGNFGILFDAVDDCAHLEAEVDQPQLLDLDEMAAILEHGGDFAKYFTGYEYRPQQVEMLKAVSKALSESQHLLVEAGTGTGKSFAYLIPAAHWAYKNNTRVVISTNTINLQEQLIQKDIPDLCQALNLPIRAAVLKGRSNYLCPRRLAAIRRQGPESIDELRVLAKILVWMQENQLGDRNAINLNGPMENLAWLRFSAENEDCHMEMCASQYGKTCPYYQAQQAAQRAHLLVVNHALLLADAATGGRVLPKFEYLIVDEAHHMESATTNALSIKIGAMDVTRMIRELGSSKTGVLGHFLSICNGQLKPSDQAMLNQWVQKATELAVLLDVQMTAYFNAVDDFLLERREGRLPGNYPQQERILPATRTLSEWAAVELAWDQAHGTLNRMLEQLKVLREPMKELSENNIEEAGDVWGTLSYLYSNFEKVDNALTGLTFEPQENMIYWIELDPLRSRITLQAAPLHIGELMEKHLWFEKSSVILTSATLTTNGEFDYMRRRLNAQDASELAVGSPFDYESSALIYAPTDIPEPVDANGHQRQVEQGIVQLAKATGGRMLVLFTSYAQLKRTSEAISPALAKEEISVFEQGEGASAHSLLEAFRETDKAVLLGTRAFWEGVDVPGNALSVLVIVKLPFDVPSDPVIAARAETFDDAFNEYNVPEAILRFRQGFGRLIRTQTDRGVVVILDKRVLTKRYGRLFLASLPTCTFKQGLLADLPRHATRWLNI